MYFANRGRKRWEIEKRLEKKNFTKFFASGQNPLDFNEICIATNWRIFKAESWRPKFGLITSLLACWQNTLPQS